MMDKAKLEIEKNALEAAPPTSSSGTTIMIEKPIDGVFQLISDPIAWQLADQSFTTKGPSERPIKVGTTWEFQKRKYSCRSIVAPTLLSLSCDGVGLDLHLASETPERTAIRLVIGKERSSRIAEVHFGLLAQFKKLAEGFVGAPHFHRVQVIKATQTYKPFPSLSVETVVEINCDSAKLFETIAAKPEGFWRWMTDRKNPGGLQVSSDWPQKGSFYKFKLPTNTPLIRILFYPPFSRWDRGIVRVIDVAENKYIVLHEMQENIRAEITTRFVLEQLPQPLMAGRIIPCTRLSSRYEFVIKHWLFRRFFGGAILSVLPEEVAQQTANIKAVCERKA